MFSLKRQQGAGFEHQARLFLEAKGLKFIAANQHFKCGELDLIMQDGQTIVFVEVRQRSSSAFGSAVESVDWQKQQKWLNARYYVAVAQRFNRLKTLKSLLKF